MDDAPPPSPEDRAAAAARAIRARREAAAADRADASTRGRTHHPARSTGRTRRTVLVTAAAAAGVLVAAAVVWGVVQAQPPAPQQTIAAPTATSTPSPTPTPTPTYTLVQVGEDLMANPDPDRPLTNWTEPDELVAATALGERAGWTAAGYLSDAGRFCMSINNTLEGHGNCVPGEVFMEEGITVDRGGWEVTWMPDGTVTWTGI